MAQTRFELAGVELAQARQAVIRIMSLSILFAWALASALFFLSVLMIALFWDTHRLIAIAVCASFYGSLALFFYFRLKAALVAQSSFFEATVAELGRDKQALMNGLGVDQGRQ
jgi:uncharacterized membrane protein YqjE